MSPDSILKISDGHYLPLLKRVKDFTPFVLFMTFYLSVTAWNYGYDVAVFGGVQAMAPFIARFGVCNSSTDSCAIPSHLASIMNSFPYLGKLIGCWIAAPVAEKFGRKTAILVIIFTSFLGVILQISATSAAQFTVGRVLCYGMTGVCVIVMPSFMAECAPASLRGMVIAQLQGQIVTAQLIAAVINYGTSTIPSNKGWRISIGIQFIMPGLLLLLYPFVVESPRWLLSQGRIDEAFNSLQKLRMESEDSVRDEMILLSSSEGNKNKGTWKEVFNANNRRRTLIAMIAMVGQQITGQAFATQYSIVFYKQQGFTNSFALGLVMQALGVTAVLITTTIIDGFGRRRLLIGGGMVQAAFLYIMGSIGTIAKPTGIQKNVMVASFMLFFFFYLLAWAPLPYVILGEATSRRLVEKTSNFAVSLSVITAFTVSFTVPYLVNADFGNLGARVGFIYGSLSVAISILTFFFIPEMKGRSLEELDALFAEKTPTSSFRRAVVTSNAPVRGKEGPSRVATKVLGA